MDIAQVFYLFGDGFLQEHVALEQSRVEQRQLVSAVHLGGKRRDRYQAAVVRWNCSSKTFILFLAEKTEEEKKA